MPHWSQGRVTLVGDACQAVSLLAGQGASMAMGGAYVLARALAEHPLPAALAQYEAHVRPMIVKKQAIGRRTANWFVPQYQWHITLRNTILRLSEKPAFAWLLRPVLAAGSESVVKQAAVL